MNNQDIYPGRLPMAAFVRACGKSYRRLARWDSRYLTAALLVSILLSLAISIVACQLIGSLVGEKSAAHPGWYIWMTYLFPTAITVLYAILRNQVSHYMIKRINLLKGSLQKERYWQSFITAWGAVISVVIMFGIPMLVLWFSWSLVAKGLTWVSIWFLSGVAVFYVFHKLKFEERVWSPSLLLARAAVLNLALAKAVACKVIPDEQSNWDDVKSWKALEMAILIPATAPAPSEVSL